jgi:sulfur carrier protein ThiS
MKVGDLVKLNQTYFNCLAENDKTKLAGIVVDIEFDFYKHSTIGNQDRIEVLWENGEITKEPNAFLEPA